MDVFTVLLLGVALSMDAFAVSVCKGLAADSPGPKEWVTVGLWFGGFQALMPIIGYYLGGAVAGAVSDYAFIIAAGIIAVIGLNMLREAFSGGAEEDDGSLKAVVMLLLAVATSIDALAAGFSMGLEGADIFVSAAIIGIVTFSLSAFGMAAAGRVRSISTRNAYVIGGIVLILIAVKILAENIFFRMCQMRISV